MPDDSTSANAALANTPTQIEFLENQRPALTSGDYIITVKQELQTGAAIKGDAQITFADNVTRKFSVYGDRFTLNPKDVHAVFPPADSLGEHSNVLPHIIFNSSSLPWERAAIPILSTDEPKVQDHKRIFPWLALLLFEADELQDLLSQSEFEQALRDLGGDAKGVWAELVRQSWLDTSGQPEAIAKIQPQGLRQELKLPAPLVAQIQTVLNGVVAPKNVRAGSLVGDHTQLQSIKWLKLTLESAQHADDLVCVIDVPKATLSQILPTADELRYLAHVRQNKNGDEAIGAAQAVIICNRLPKAGVTSIVHLVSVENYYTEKEGFAFPTGMKDNELVRLVSLYSWRFVCLDEKQSFAGLLTQLNHPLLATIPTTKTSYDALSNGQVPTEVQTALLHSDPALKASSATDSSKWRVLDHAVTRVVERGRYFLIGAQGQVYNQAGAPLTKITVSPSNRETDMRHWWLAHEGEAGQSHRYFLALLGSLETPAAQPPRLALYRQDLEASHALRLPAVTHETAEKFLRLGFVPVRHRLRSRGKTISWYRGPFVPFAPEPFDPAAQLNVTNADELVRYQQSNGMFEVSYAAAWELGRLLALCSKKISTALFNWKRNHRQQIKQAEQQELHPHLPFGHGQTLQALPAELESWLANLSLLRGVPFNYLVPDERLLPKESMRFFYIDPQWLACLIHGAFSVGRVTRDDHARDKATLAQLKQNPSNFVSGVLLRSAVVAGWPDLQVDAFNHEFEAESQEAQEIAADKKLLCLRQEILSQNVLLCLFAGRELKQANGGAVSYLEGDAKIIDIHQKPERLHFGVDLAVDKNGSRSFSKRLRDQAGNEIADSSTPVPLRSRNVVDIATLLNTDALKKALVSQDVLNPAQFAMEMIEGVQKVRFIRKP